MERFGGRGYLEELPLEGWTARRREDFLQQLGNFISIWAH